MANLVAPVNLLPPAEERIIEFKGLNRRDAVEEGEMSDMRNLTSDNYPLLTPRKRRGTYTLPEGVILPLKIMARYNRIAMIAKDSEENIGFWYDGQRCEDVVGLSQESEMVAINTKICFFPEKTYIEIVQDGYGYIVGDYGHLDLSEEITTASVVLTQTDAQLTIPALPSGYTLGYDDAIDIHIRSYTPQGGSLTPTSFDISAAIQEVLDNETTLTIVLPRETFIEMTGQGVDQFTISGTIDRFVPDLDCMIEWNNRLWGANNMENIIYACKLGDPKNWHYYQGTGLDSYYAQQGTDGTWTGCAAYSSHIIFFKQNSMSRIYGSSPTNFQITNTQCYGVEEGSSGSVVTVNDVVFYNSVVGIMAYEGGSPYLISDKLGKKFKYVVGGTDGHKYYASIRTKDFGPELMVLDVERGVWHKEDEPILKDTCQIDNRMYFIEHESESMTCSDSLICDSYLLVGSGEPSSGAVKIVNPVNETEIAEDVEWSAVFGPFDEYIENRKIYSRILLRLKRDEDSEVSVYISENEGAWELVQKFDPAKTGGDYIPIIPRRCDRYSIKIEGIGKCSIKSLTRKVRRGTGGRL